MSSDRAFHTGILGESYFLPPHMLMITLSLGRGICNQEEWEGGGLCEKGRDTHKKIEMNP